MMGFRETSARLFYDFCLDEHVPADHMLRGIDRHLDLAELRESLKPFYSQMGRPSVDPELMIRMLIVGYGMATRRFTSISPIADFAGSDSTAVCPTTRRSRRTDTGAFARVMRCVAFSRAWCNVASQRAWSAPTGLQSTPA
jgi:hypothetical protein